MTLAERHRAVLARLDSADGNEWRAAAIDFAAIVAEELTTHRPGKAHGRWLAENGLPWMHPSEARALEGLHGRQTEFRAALEQGRRAFRTIYESGVSKGKTLTQVRPRAVAPPIAPITGLKPEEVDPELAKNPLAFRARYGQVNLDTKAEFERSQKQGRLQRWLRVAGVAAITEPPDPETLREWASKRGKAAKLERLIAGLESSLAVLKAAESDLSVQNVIGGVSL
jgi:hypothetical protein